MNRLSPNGLLKIKIFYANAQIVVENQVPKFDIVVYFNSFNGKLGLLSATALMV